MLSGVESSLRLWSICTWMNIWNIFLYVKHHRRERYEESFDCMCHSLLALYTKRIFSLLTRPPRSLDQNTKALPREKISNLWCFGASVLLQLQTKLYTSGHTDGFFFFFLLTSWLSGVSSEKRQQWDGERRYR